MRKPEFLEFMWSEVHRVPLVKSNCLWTWEVLTIAVNDLSLLTGSLPFASFLIKSMFMSFVLCHVLIVNFLCHPHWNTELHCSHWAACFNHTRISIFFLFIFTFMESLNADFDNCPRLWSYVIILNLNTSRRRFIHLLSHGIKNEYLSKNLFCFSHRLQYHLSNQLIRPLLSHRSPY